MKKSFYIVFGILILLIASFFFLPTKVVQEEENVLIGSEESRVGVTVGVMVSELPLEKQEEIRNGVTKVRPDLKEEELQNSRYLTRYDLPEINLESGEIIKW